MAIKSIYPLIICLGLIGCADPVTKLLKDNGNFALVRPPSTGMHLGDVHRTTNLQEESIPMSDVMGERKLEEMMKKRSRQVALPTNSGSSSYDITAKAAYVGVAETELGLKGAKKFSVTVTNPVIYDAPFDSLLAPKIIPEIQKTFPRVSLEDKFIVRSLLGVQGMEYEFFNDKGGKIDIAADKNLVKGLTAKLGGSWQVTKSSKLIINKPRFIGYRLARVTRKGGVEGVGAMPAGQAPEYQLQEIGPKEYENAQAR